MGAISNRNTEASNPPHMASIAPRIVNRGAVASILAVVRPERGITPLRLLAAVYPRMAYAKDRRDTPARAFLQELSLTHHLTPQILPANDLPPTHSCS